MNTKMILSALVALLCVTTAPYSIAAPTDDSDPASGLPDGCKEAILAARAYIEANAGPLDFGTALLHLQATAGDVCGFDVSGVRPTTTDPEAMAAFLASLGAGAREAVEDSAPPAPQWSLDPYPCPLPGNGVGNIYAVVLGITVDTLAADGAWGQGEKIGTVEGSAGLVSGSQTGRAGTIFVGPIPIPVTDGSSGMTCVTIETVESVKQECRVALGFFHVEGGCEYIVEMKGKVVPCGSSASQPTILGLAALNHAYRVTPAPEGCT